MNISRAGFIMRSLSIADVLSSGSPVQGVEYSPVPSTAFVPVFTPPMRAIDLLKVNVDALLRKQHKPRQALAFALGLTESGLSKAFARRTGLPAKYFDRV